MEATITITDVEKMALIGLVSHGLSNSIRGLSEMVGQEIEITSLNPKIVDIREVPGMFGDPEALTVGVYTQVRGIADGHILLVYQPQVAFDLMDMLLGYTPGSTTSIGKLERSALAEMGNIMGTFFLNAVAESLQITLLPRPPAVVMDMAGAILTVPLVEIIKEMDEVYIVESNFGTIDRQVEGTFLVLPSLGLIKRVKDIWEKY